MCWRKRIGWEGMSILQVTPGWSRTDSFMEQSFKKWLSTTSPGAALEPGELWEDPAGIWAECQAFRSPRPTRMAVAMVMMASRRQMGICSGLATPEMWPGPCLV